MRQEQHYQQQAVKAGLLAKRQASARARRYYNEYELHLKAKLQKRRIREEQVVLPPLSSLFPPPPPSSLLLPTPSSSFLSPPPLPPPSSLLSPSLFLPLVKLLTQATIVQFLPLYLTLRLLPLS